MLQETEGPNIEIPHISLKILLLSIMGLNRILQLNTSPRSSLPFIKLNGKIINIIVIIPIYSL
jgi:hypothetical protein